MNYVDFFFIFSPIETLAYHKPRNFIDKKGDTNYSDRKNAKTVDTKQWVLDQIGALGSKKMYPFSYNN